LWLHELLDVAFKNRHREIIFYLLDLISTRIDRALLNGLLCIGADGCPVDTLQLLLTKYRCDVNYEKDGRRPLQIAATNGFLDIVKFFASVPNIDVNALSDTAPPALHQTANAGLAEIVEFLLTVDGIDINARDTRGLTALHYAARWNQVDVIRLLLETPGIDLTIVEERTVFLSLFFKHSLIMWFVSKSSSSCRSFWTVRGSILINRIRMVSQSSIWHCGRKMRNCGVHSLKEVPSIHQSRQQKAFVFN
jgi:ankyrin repeat protein